MKGSRDGQPARKRIRVLIASLAACLSGTLKGSDRLAILAPAVAPADAATGPLEVACLVKDASATFWQAAIQGCKDAAALLDSILNGGLPDYPGTNAGLLVDHHVAGTECFRGVVADHPLYEFRSVLQGTGLALDAQGGGIPIAPGGAELSPAGPSGAHGCRHTGAVPLDPSRDGKPPGRTAFAGVGTAPSGPLSAYRPPDKLAPQPPDYPGTHVGLLVDREVAGTERFGGIVSIDDRIPLHDHPVFDFQYVLSGTGVANDSPGVEVPIAPGGAVLSPAGPSGAHGFQNTGATPLKILFLYPAPDGRPPGRTADEVPRSAV